tara:strand:- start:613 stop:846 length:234 start_codon:yes stop_codon:yes gene_type:complete
MKEVIIVIGKDSTTSVKDVKRIMLKLQTTEIEEALKDVDQMIQEKTIEPYLLTMMGNVVFNRIPHRVLSETEIVTAS